MSATTYPKLYGWMLSTVACGERADRWSQRRAVLIAQRDWRLTEIRMLETIRKSCGRVTTSMIRRAESPIKTLNRKIDECNEMLEALQVTR